jgi:hypothetical protein
MSMRRLGVFAAAGMTVGPIVGGAARADVTAPAGLTPGDHFRLVFVTGGTTPATSTDISTYDALVSAEASGAGLSTYGGSPVTWQALGSTEGGVAAIDRLSTSVPIYRLDGTQVATDNTDLWDGAIAAAINQTPAGATLDNGVTVWTGSNSNGTESKGLGGESGFTQFGLIATDNTWMTSNTADPAESHNLYAFSNDLTVVPEPASAAMVGLAAVSLAASRRRTRHPGARRRR